MSLTSKKFEKPLLIFTLIDIFFAPYVFFLATTFSQLFVFLWFVLKDKRVFQRREVRFYYWILFFIALSVIVSFFTIPDNLVGEYVVENIKQGLNTGMAITYYFFFFYMLKSSEINIEKWVFAFLVYVSIWGVLYYLNMNAFLLLKRFFNPRDSFLSFLNMQFYFFRFNFIWTDPNNVGYALVGIVAFLIMSKKTSNITLIISTLLLMFNLLLIMSAGSIIIALLIIPTAILVRIKNRFNAKSLILVVLSLFAIAYSVINFADQFTESYIGIKSIERLNEKEEEGDSRFNKYEQIYQSKNIFPYFFVGEGNILFVNGENFSPHSVHLMFIFGYGLICYFLYMYLIFRKTRSQLWVDFIFIGPFFICLTVNVGLGELKYAAIMYMLVAYSRIKSIESQFVINQK